MLLGTKSIGAASRALPRAAQGRRPTYQQLQTLSPYARLAPVMEHGLADDESTRTEDHIMSIEVSDGVEENPVGRESSIIVTRMKNSLPIELFGNASLGGERKVNWKMRG